MPDAFGTHADVYFGDPDRPLPDWRAADAAAAMFVLVSGSTAARRDPDDDDEPTPAERAAVVGMLGFDPAEFDEAPRPEEKRMTYAARLRRILYCRDDASCTSCPRPARKLYRVAPGRPGRRMRILYAAGQSTPLVRNAAGQHVSARAKSGSSKCSQAASDWRTGKATPDTFKALAQCRAMAGSKHAAHLHRLAGNEAHAQHIEKVLGGIHVTKKSRDEQAKLLQARRSGRAGATMARGKAEPAPAVARAAAAAEAHEGDFAMEPIPAGAKSTAAKLPPREGMDVRNPGWEQATRAPVRPTFGAAAADQAPAAPQPAGKIAAASAAHRAKVGAKRAAAPPPKAAAAPSTGRAAAMAKQEAKPPAPAARPAKTDSDRAAQLDRIAGKAKGRADTLHAAKGEALASKVKANAMAGAGHGSPEAAAEAEKAHAGIAARLDRLEGRRVQVGGMSGKLTGKLRASTKKIDRANTKAERAEGREPPAPPKSGPGPAPTPPAPAPAPAKPAGGFGLRQESAVGTKKTEFANAGGGRTGTMFDMKRGDLPGQTSLMDRVGSVDTRAGTPAAPAPAPAPAAPHAYGSMAHVDSAFKGSPGARNNFVTLEAFRNAMGGTREQQDAAIRAHRVSGRYSLDSHEGRTDRQLTPGEKAAAVHEKGSSPLAYISRHGADSDPEGAAPAPAARPAPFTPQEKRALARALPKMTGGSPAALMQRVGTDLARRGKVAGRIQRLRSAVARSRIDPASHTNHAPGTITPLATHLIHADPERFQYKLGHAAATGSVGSLAGARWNPELGGLMQVWKDPADGKTYVINGHNRLDLARRAGAGRVNAQFIDAPNAEAAKAKGALKNIAGGRGTSIDAANFFRNSGIGKEDLERHGIAMKDKVANEGVALSRLHDPLFRRVVEGTLHPEKAAMIGGAGLTHPQQHAVVKQLDRAAGKNPITTGHLRELLDNAREAGSVKTQTHDLFGSNEEETSLALHRARVQSAIRDRLGREKRLFGTVARAGSAQDLARAGNVINAAESGKVSQQAGGALDVFDQLKNRSGTIAPALNRAAERIHAGEHPKQVIDETYAHVLSEAGKLIGGDRGGAAKSPAA